MDVPDDALDQSSERNKANQVNSGNKDGPKGGSQSMIKPPSKAESEDEVPMQCSTAANVTTEEQEKIKETAFQEEVGTFMTCMANFELVS